MKENFLPKLKCRAKYLDLSSPIAMGILNVSPNSFSSTGRFMDVQLAIRHAERMFKEGAAIIDVGGESTNPGVHPVASLQEELDRVMPVIEILCKELPIPISVDTSKPEVMSEAIKHGVGLINDIRGLRAEGAMEIIARNDVAVCLMHMAYPQGRPIDAEITGDIISIVKNFLAERIKTCEMAGISRERIMIDPGIGHGNFGKSTKQNLLLLKHLAEFKSFHLPILAGVSRKTFIGKLLNIPEEERLPGSLAATVFAIQNGVNIIRTHDVKATIEAIRITQAVLEVENESYIKQT